MKRLIGVALGAALMGAHACAGHAPIGGGAAGTGGGAGSSGMAGTDIPTGLAGTSGSAGASGMCAANAFKRDGVCQCQPSIPNVCSGRCVDVQTDPDNCGCCGHACDSTETCVQGKCGPMPVAFALASPLCEAIDLAVGGGTLYWTDRGAGRVSSMPTSGGAITTIASDLPSPSQVAVNGDAVYWLVPNRIMRSVRGGPPQIVVMTPAAINGFVVSPDGASVYYSTERTVMRIPGAGGAQTVVASEGETGTPRALALDGDLLVLAVGNEGAVDVVTLREGKVANCGYDGGDGFHRGEDCLRVARGQGTLLPEKVVAQQGFVLWANGVTLNKSDTPLNGVPDQTQVGSTDFASISGFATTTTTAYFAEGGLFDGTSTIYKAPLDTPQTQESIPIARGQLAPRSVVVDDKRVYWSTAGCAIMATDL